MNAYIIGNNLWGQFGLNHKDNITKLTPYEKMKNLKNIWTSNLFNIYQNANGDYFAAGACEQGQCGIGESDWTIKELTKISLSSFTKDKIDKICCGTAASCTMWITDKQTLYINGGNDIPTSAKALCPVLVANLNNIINAASSYHYNLALAADGTVFATSYSDYGGNGHPQNKQNQKDGWKPIETFKNQKIKTIACGADYSLFLDHNGKLYSSGSNYLGQCGLGHKRDSVFVPRLIKYFNDNKIKIKHMECGGGHNIAVDVDDNAYSWGRNEEGQCGDGTTDNVLTPKLIPPFKGQKINEIKCGRKHSFIATNNGQYYLFGNNEYGECLTTASKKVLRPYLINNEQIIKEKMNSTTYKMQIALGYDLTVIFFRINYKLLVFGFYRSYCKKYVFPQEILAMMIKYIE